MSKTRCWSLLHHPRVAQVPVGQGLEQEFNEQCECGHRGLSASTRRVALHSPGAASSSRGSRFRLALRAASSGKTHPRSPIAAVNPTKVAIHPATRHQARSEGVTSRGITHRSITPRAPGAPNAKLLRTIAWVERGRAGARPNHLRPTARMTTAATVPAIGDTTTQYRTSRWLLASPVKAGNTTTDQTNSNTLSARASTSVRHNSFVVLTVLSEYTYMKAHFSALVQPSSESDSTGSSTPSSDHRNQLRTVITVLIWAPTAKVPP